MINNGYAMILLNCKVSHIIQVLGENIGNMKDLSYVFLNVFLGIGAYKGLKYLKTYKEKRNAATFTFWMQLRIRMVEIKSWLEEAPDLVDYLYDETTRGEWLGDPPIFDERIQQFKKMIEETNKFIKDIPDQMPAYVGWTDDYNEFIKFLNDSIQFDISDGYHYFKFGGGKDIMHRDKYVQDICNIIDKMSKEIVLRQKNIELELELDREENIS